MKHKENIKIKQRIAEILQSKLVRFQHRPILQTGPKLVKRGEAAGRPRWLLFLSNPEAKAWFLVSTLRIPIGTWKKNPTQALHGWASKTKAPDQTQWPLLWKKQKIPNEAQQSGLFLFHPHVTLLKSIYFYSFFSSFILCLWNQDEIKVVLEKIGEQQKTLGEKVRRAEPFPAMSGNTPQCLSSSALWSPLWYFFILCIAVVLYLLYVWCGFSVSFLWVGPQTSSAAPGAHESPR